MMGAGHHDAHDPGDQGTGWHGDQHDVVGIIDRPSQESRG